MNHSNHTWTVTPGTSKSEPTGVTVFASTGDQTNYPTATSFEVVRDDGGALYVFKDDSLKAIHAPGRWDSAVVHAAKESAVVPFTVRGPNGEPLAHGTFPAV